MPIRVTAAEEGPQDLLTALSTDSQRASPGGKPLQLRPVLVVSFPGTVFHSIFFDLRTVKPSNVFFSRFRIRLTKSPPHLCTEKRSSIFLVCYCLNSIRIFFRFNDSSPTAIQLSKTVTGQ